MEKYIDGFVLAVPEDKLAEYKKMAEEGGKIWKKYGALEYYECVGDDMSPTMGGMEFLKFPELMKIKPGEVVIFSFIVYKSRAHRDEVNAKVMKDPMMNDPAKKDQPMPFDMKRMAYGGFRTIVGF